MDWLASGDHFRIPFRITCLIFGRIERDFRGYWILVTILIFLELISKKLSVKSAGLQANISMVINTLGTFTTLFNLEFLQDNEVISTQSHHQFYSPANLHKWNENFNITNFHYNLHSIDPLIDRISMTWQHGIPPPLGSKYGIRACRHGQDTEWRCVRRNCYDCPRTYGWLVCQGFLNCSGEEKTWIYDGDQACSDISSSTRILCGGDGKEGFIITRDISGSGRRNFSFWTVATHRFRKFLFGLTIG